MLTDREKAAIDATVAAWNAFVALPVEHPDDVCEVRHAIHSIQNAILCRPVRRALSNARLPKGSS